MVRTPSVDENGIRRGTWSEEEDNILKAYVFKHGRVNWRQLPRYTGLARCGKSCRLRWKNYLKPGIKRGNYTQEEVKQIIKLRQEFGNKWSLIASKLPGRTDNEIKNYYHTHLKNLTKQGRNLFISTIVNVKNLDRVSSSLEAVDSFLQPQTTSMTSNSSSLEHWESLIDSFQAFEEFSHEPFNTSDHDFITQSLDPSTHQIMLEPSNSQISASAVYDLGLSDEVASSFGSEPFTIHTLNNQFSASTICDLGLSDEFARSFGREPFTVDSLNNQIYDSTIFDLGLLSDEVTRSSGTEPFSLDTLYTQISAFILDNFRLFSDKIASNSGSEPFSLDTLNTQIFASILANLWLSDEVARSLGSEPFSLDNSNNQNSASTIYDFGLSDEIERRFESEPFTVDTLNNQILPSTDFNYAQSGVDWSQPMSMNTSSNDSTSSPARSDSEECCLAPFMPLSSGDSDLINLLSVLDSFNDDNYQNNITMSPHLS